MSFSANFGSLINAVIIRPLLVMKQRQWYLFWHAKTTLSIAPVDRGKAHPTVGTWFRVNTLSFVTLRSTGRGRMTVPADLQEVAFLLDKTPLESVTRRSTTKE